jgi:hypothetical protein
MHVSHGEANKVRAQADENQGMEVLEGFEHFSLACRRNWSFLFFSLDDESLLDANYFKVMGT